MYKKYLKNGVYKTLLEMKKNIENKKSVTSEEHRKIFLAILDEVDGFCRSNGIRYSISYGTLLGAVRHRGFIPWDHDLDINMPYPDMIRFKESFHSKDFKYCDVDTERFFEYPFSRVSYLPTYQKVGLRGESYGVSIDLYPVVGCPDDDSEVERFFSKGRRRVFIKRGFVKTRYELMKVIPIQTIPGFNTFQRNYRNFMLQFPYDYGRRFFHVGGFYKWYEVFDFDMFEEMVELDFEGRKYLATARYDEYLTQLYGDYITPPPESQRTDFNKSNYFWR